AIINPTGLSKTRGIATLRRTPRMLGRAYARLLRTRAVPRTLVEFILRRLAYCHQDLLEPRTIDEYWAPTATPGFVNAALTLAEEYDWEPLAPEQLQRLPMRSLVITGLEDRLIRGAATAARQLPDVEIASFDGGHCVQEERPA